MFYNLLILHSVFRWIVLITLFFTFTTLVYKKTQHQTLTQKTFRLLIFCCIILNVQLIIGIFLFSESDLVGLFWQNFNETVKLRQPRFFGLEHPTMMILGIILFNYFTFKSKNKINQIDGVSYFLNRFIIILILILSSVPWSFSPLTSRPNFRF